MSGWLLYTNILSELRKGHRCDAGVIKWVLRIDDEALFTSVLVLGEIRNGIERLRIPDEPQALALEQWLLTICNDYADRILHVDQRIAEQWGRLGVRQPLPVVDALLAATALCHDLTLVSRDTRGFLNAGVRYLNPFSK